MLHLGAIILLACTVASFSRAGVIQERQVTSDSSAFVTAVCDASSSAKILAHDCRTAFLAFPFERNGTQLTSHKKHLESVYGTCMVKIATTNHHSFQVSAGRLLHGDDSEKKGGLEAVLQQCSEEPGFIFIEGGTHHHGGNVELSINPANSDDYPDGHSPGSNYPSGPEKNPPADNYPSNPDHNATTNSNTTHPNDNYPGGAWGPSNSTNSTIPPSFDTAVCSHESQDKKLIEDDCRTAFIDLPFDCLDEKLKLNQSSISRMEKGCTVVVTAFSGPKIQVSAASLLEGLDGKGGIDALFRQCGGLPGSIAIDGGGNGDTNVRISIMSSNSLLLPSPIPTSIEPAHGHPIPMGPGPALVPRAVKSSTQL